MKRKLITYTLLASMTFLIACGGEDTNKKEQEDVQQTVETSVTNSPVKEITNSSEEKENEDIKSENETKSETKPVTAAAVLVEEQTKYYDMIQGEVEETKEPDLKNTKIRAKKTSLKVPEDSMVLYQLVDGTLAGDDPYHRDSSKKTTSYYLKNGKWKGFDSPIDKAREKNKLSYDDAFEIVPQKNGDVVFVSGTDGVICLTKKGKIKWEFDAAKLYQMGVEHISKMQYLGEGKAILEIQKEEYPDIFNQNEEVVESTRVELVDLKNTRLLTRYPENYKLCGMIDDKTCYLVNGRKIVEMNISDATAINKYTTEPIWRQGWTYKDKDADGHMFHAKAIRWTVYKGELYGLHVSGIYKLSKENGTEKWIRLMATKSRKDVICSMNIDTFIMLSKNKAVVGGIYTYKLTDSSYHRDVSTYEW